ncbi:potassium transporter Kup [Bosea sp. (in: a-proteobacteria)]|jgi:KUP system potassium uptake protein|uniref:potassium transporter Kup n=1 Tax=Bosea sp. (in: a-proteobacteria) TaxID=1871050 RepID=UPI00086E5592|nr:potassium transporter Kup [Bosea sp. (in: a-proteobacteria)]MBN9438863.1 potassium transporter Kup [Bosea sp. (in: a-proteobacteria)]ODT54798.1 MAG: potassium transporter Kup [Methylobacterium sp. SCN 67-24]
MGHDQQNPAPAKPDGDRFGLEEPVSGGHSSHSYAALALGALGVVFGDIGTSPLYALRETILAATGAASGGHGGAVDVTLAGPLPREVILGVLSLILWSLVSVVTLKYVVLLLRADNNGEGGTLTLVALAQRALGRSRGGVVLFLGMAGAALFYGDAVITPAISVLSAIEGIKLVTPVLDDYVVSIASVIMIALFLVQSRGTAKVANFFGPVMTLWFLTLGGLGIYHISDDLGVLASINPYYGLRFFVDHPGLSLAVLGTVCLAVTGAEALYADMGHFGRGPIRGAWLYLVFPALWLNYLGQGALILSDSSAIENPFFRLAPQGFTLPLVIMATIATIIASQAVITGAFSLTRQAIQLGLLPRLEIRHTSEHTSGQIFIPRMNTLLLLTVLLLIWTFRTSSNLSHAYGISVFGAMAVDSLLAFIVIWRGWRWSLLATSLVLVPFLLIDIAFFSANLLKLFSGGYVPVLFAIALTVLMWTWVRGTRILFDKTRKTDVPLLELVGMLTKSPPYRVKGMAVFLTSDPETAPASLLHNLKHNKVLHERNVILTVRSADTPRVAESERVRLSRITEDFWRVEMVYGYMESPNIPKGLAILRKQGFKFDIMSTSFFLSRRSIKASPNSGMPVWQDNLFIGLTKSATDATNFFQIPTGRVVEVGTQVTV